MSGEPRNAVGSTHKKYIRVNIALDLQRRSVE